MTELPCRFGKYELLEHIAKGGMADVFRARSFGVEGFEKPVVIKRLLPGLATSPRFVAMFVQEARISAGLSHPNIIQIFELGRVADDHYIAMEHIHGRDLTRVTRALNRRGERLPMALAVLVIANVLRGLGYAHAATDHAGRRLHLVHRDVSPQNIVLSFHGEVKLVNFGIARLMSEPDAKAVVAAGKSAYMSPEQAASRPVDGRSDIFSAGVVLYELLVGHRLFQHDDPAEKMRLVLDAVIPDPRLEVPDLPDALWAVLSQMLARDPDDRPQRAEDAEAALRAFLFEHRLAAGASDLGGFLRALFGDERAADPGAASLAALAEDLERLGRSEEADGDTPEGPPAWAFNTPPLEEERPAAALAPVSVEQKPVVVLIAEVCGLTDLSVSRGAEAVVRRHVQLLRRIRRVVDRFDGLLERYQDDTFVVFFGVPRAGEDDVRRALAAADGLHNVSRSLGRRGLSVALSIGVHRGELAVGKPEGRGYRYLARGDTMKTAWRLCQEADLGETLVSRATAEVAGDAFSFCDGPTLHRKGHREALVTALLLGRKAGQRPLEGGLGRWLWRADELEVLRTAFRDLGDGKGGSLLIRGERGAGKSRLLREVAELARHRGLPCYAGRPPALADDLPFAPFRELVAAMLRLDTAWSRAEVLAGLEGLVALGLSEGDRALLAALFAVDLGSPVEPSEEAMLGTAARLVSALARRGPVVLAMEDVERLAGPERRLIAHVLRLSSRAPVLFLLSSAEALPEGMPECSYEIRLDKLLLERQEALIAELCGADAVAGPLLDLVAAAAEGNPLYITELVKALQQRGQLRVVEGEARLEGEDRALYSLPAGLESLIAARVDALDPEAKALLQVAAILGAALSARLLMAVASLDPADPQGRAPLERLLEHGLLVREGDSPDRLAFGSQLIWEVVHRAILDGQRRGLHARAVDAIERHFAGALESQLQALASHSAAAGRYLAAARYAGQVGAVVVRQQALEAAAQWWERGVQWVELASSADSGGGDQREVELLLRLHAGEVWSLVGQRRKAERHLHLALDLAEERGDGEAEARAMLALGRLHQAQGEAIQARAHLETALSLCRAEDRRRRVEVLESLGLLALDEGRGEDARRCYERALEVAGDDGTLAAQALLGLATGQLREGREGQALALLHVALQKADMAGDRILAGRVVNNIGIAHYNAGRYAEALERFRRALDIRQGLGYRRGAVVNLHNIGDTYLRMGDLGRAWAAFQESRDLSVDLGWERGVVMNDVYLAFIEGMRALTEPDGALDSVEGGAPMPDAVSTALATAVPRLQGAALMAERLLDPETAVVARWLLGRLLHRLGRLEDAAAALEAAHGLAERLEAHVLARDVEQALCAVAGPQQRVRVGLG